MTENKALAQKPPRDEEVILRVSIIIKCIKNKISQIKTKTFPRTDVNKYCGVER